MKKVVGSFQKMTLTLERTRTQARRMPGRVYEGVEQVRTLEKQRSITHEMLRSEVLALGAVQEQIRKQALTDQERNGQSLQSFQDSIQMHARLVASALDEVQLETIALGAALRQNLNSQTGELRQLDEIDVQSDYQRQTLLHNFEGVLEETSHLSSTTSTNLFNGANSMGAGLGIQNEMAEQEKLQAAYGLNQEAARMLAENNPGAAVEALQQAVRLVPGEARFWFNLAQALTAFSDLEGAEDALSKAVALSPDDPQMEQVSGWIALRKGDYASAVDHFQLALKKDLSLVQEMDLLEGCAEAAYRAGMPDLAESAWKQVMKRDPYHPIAPIALEWMR